jgi:hypothetical protein
VDALPRGVPGLLCLGCGVVALGLGGSISHPVIAGWLGVIGMILTLHYGLFYMLALILNGLGLRVRPIMGNPLGLTSLTRFWGGTWNRAFTDAIHPLVVRPLTRRFGAKRALLLAFFLSGLAHELVISFPAGAGYGGPMVYFLLQAFGMMAERSPRGRRWHLSQGIWGRCPLTVCVLAPAPILFHPPFLEKVIQLFLQFLTTHVILL